MPKPIAFLAIPGSSVSADVAAELDRAGFAGDAFHALSLDAPRENKPVTVAPGAVLWEGVDLLQTGAIFVERPLFLWPQPQLPPWELQGEAAYKQWFVFQREADSLAASAIAAAAEVRPVVNPPGAVHLAVSPSLALDHLARQGLPIHPWALEPAPPLDGPESAIVLDACGRDRWHSPARPQPGEPSLVLEPFWGEVVALLVVGERIAGAMRYPDGEAWADQRRAGEACETGAVAEADRIAIQATRALGLDFAAVSVRASATPPAILLCEAAPDLSAWGKSLGSRLPSALAHHLITLATQ